MAMEPAEQTNQIFLSVRHNTSSGFLWEIIIYGNSSFPYSHLLCFMEASLSLRGIQKDITGWGIPSFKYNTDQKDRVGSSQLAGAWVITDSNRDPCKYWDALFCFVSITINRFHGRIDLNRQMLYQKFPCYSNYLKLWIYFYRYTILQ